MQWIFRQSKVLEYGSNIYNNLSIISADDDVVVVISEGFFLLNEIKFS